MIFAFYPHRCMHTAVADISSILKLVGSGLREEIRMITTVVVTLLLYFLNTNDTNLEYAIKEQEIEEMVHFSTHAQP